MRILKTRKISTVKLHSINTASNTLCGSGEYISLTHKDILLKFPDHGGVHLHNTFPSKREMGNNS